MMCILGGVGGGILLFLTGIGLMSRSAASFLGDKTKKAITFYTGNPLRTFFIGMILTAVVQSSSLITVITVGLVHAGALTLKGGIAVILGANVGTTITAQLFSLHVEEYGIYLIFLSGIVYLWKGKKTAFIFLGLGFVLTGLNLLASGLASFGDPKALRLIFDFASKSPASGVAAGALAAAIVQSSSAVTALVIAFARNGGEELSACLSLVVGADIGTCLTSLLAAVNTNLAGKRAALAHFIFNLVSAVVIAAVLPLFARLISYSSRDISRQIANGHTLFNLIGGLLFLPLIDSLASFVEKVIPERIIK